MKYFIKYYLPQILVLLLTACGGVSPSSGGGSSNPSVANMSGIMIDPMSSVPVVNGSSTQGTLYIHNYASNAVSGLNYSLNNSTIKSQVKSLLSRAGFSISGGIEDSNGFVLLNPERCQSIAANSSCAINFSTPSLSFGNQGSSLVNISYKSISNQSLSTSQVVNYNYVDSHSIGGVNFTSNLDVTGTSGSTRYVVGYLYAGSNGGSLYRGVSLVPSSPVARISGGFINSQEVAANQVIAVEFAVAIQDSSSSYLNITPTWSSSSGSSIASVSSGAPLGLSIIPGQNVANYIFGDIPILVAAPNVTGSISVVNNGNAIGSAITVEKSGGTPSGINVDASDCTSNIPGANAVGSCQISYEVTTYTPGATTFIYKSNNVEIGRQDVYWTNSQPFPMVKILPSTDDIEIDQGESSGLITFSIQNIGNAPLDNVTLSNSITGSGLWLESNSNCGVTLGVGDSCLIQGIISGPLHGSGVLYYMIEGDYSGTPYVVSSLPVRYAILADPILNITPSSVVDVQVLANDESAVSNTYIVTNSGNAIAIIENVVLSLMTNFHKPEIANNSTCVSGDILSPSESCSVVVTYGPESSAISINESGSTHVVVNYRGGTPNLSRQAVSESYNYSLVGNDAYVIESISVIGLTGDGTIGSPYLGRALVESMAINIVYTNPSVNYPLTNFNLNTNNLPYGVVIDSAVTTCPIAGRVANLAINESCVLSVQLDRSLLTQSAQGGSVVLDWTTPRATWTTPLGFYNQRGTSVTINYLQPSVSFSLSDNNGDFESTILSMILANESAGASPFVIAVSGVSSWLESIPLALSNNCTINPSTYAASCSLAAGGNESAAIRYTMPTYLQNGESATMPLFYSSANLGFLSPEYSMINYIFYYSWVNVGNPNFSAGIARDVSLMLNSSYEPYVGYDDVGSFGGSFATVMKLSAGSNTWSVVGNANFSAGDVQYLDIAWDSVANIPYVIYRDGANSGKATVMKLDSVNNVWVAVGGPAFSQGGVFLTSIVIDNTGIPYIAYRDDGIFERPVVVLKFDGANWVSLTGSGNGAVSPSNGMPSNIVLDSAQKPYIAYSDSLHGNKLTLSKFDGTNWVIVGESGFTSGTTSYQSLALDPRDDSPYVAYQDGANDEKTTVMHFNGTNWVVVGESGFSAGYIQYTSIAIDNTGIPYVAYSDFGLNMSAVVMTFNGSSWVNAGNPNQLSTSIDGYTNVVMNESIPYVAYQNGAGNSKATVKMLDKSND